MSAGHLLEEGQSDENARQCDTYSHDSCNPGGFGIGPVAALGESLLGTLRIVAQVK